MKKRKIRSEETAKKYFANLGFTIREKDFEGKKKGADFFIELNGCIQSVEAKFYMRGFGTYLKPQIDRLKEGGLVALYENEKIIAIKTIEDVESITQIESYRIKWKNA